MLFEFRSSLKVDDEGEEEGRVNHDVDEQYEDKHLRPPRRIYSYQRTSTSTKPRRTKGPNPGSRRRRRARASKRGRIRPGQRGRRQRERKRRGRRKQREVMSNRVRRRKMVGSRGQRRARVARPLMTSRWKSMGRLTAVRMERTRPEIPWMLKGLKSRSSSSLRMGGWAWSTLARRRRSPGRSPPRRARRTLR
jgi:hypothetical protein